METYKYLGIQSALDLFWHSHTKTLCKKSRKLVGLLYTQKFRNSFSPTIMLKLFIRPNLEYASIVWSPHLKCNIEGREKVQNFALKVCLYKTVEHSIRYLDLLHQADLYNTAWNKEGCLSDYPEDTP